MANFTEHLHELEAELSHVGLRKPRGRISRSLQIGEGDKMQGRWKPLLLTDGQAGVGGCWEGQRVCTGDRGLPRGFWGLVGGVRHTWVPLGSSTPAAPSGLVLRLSQITLVPSCLLPATCQLNHSLKFGAAAKTPLPSNRIFSLRSSGPTRPITCCCNRHR